VNRVLDACGIGCGPSGYFHRRKRTQLWKNSPRLFRKSSFPPSHQPGKLHQWSLVMQGGCLFNR
jgi:hypothetical protein